METATTRTLHLEVTDADLANGEPYKCGSCPIALALIRALPGATHVYVDSWSVKWKDSSGTGYWGNLPEIASNLIQTYDCVATRLNARPIEFDLKYRAI